MSVDSQASILPKGNREKLRMKFETKRKSGWLWRWTKRFFVTIVALILTLTLASAIYQFAATQADAQKYPPRGRMVDVGGFKMHLLCTGAGSPTVVLENGHGAGSFGWGSVPLETAKFTRVCVYDRAGIGWSEPSPAGRGVNQINKELHDLLRNAGEQKPFVFGGHSLGGLYLQNYANQYPEEVAGLVLIDSSHGEQPVRYPNSSPVMLSRLLKIAAPFGVLRLLPGASDSPEDQEIAAWENSTKHLYAIADEGFAITENCRILREKPMQLGDKPLVVLSRSSKTKSGDSEKAVMNNEIWQELQTDLASRSTRSKQIIAEKAGHDIQKDEPELVINVIRQVVEGTQK